MSETLGDAILFLRTDDKQLDVGIERGRKKAEELGNTFEQTGKKLATTSGAMRMGLQQVGFQAQDFAVQVAGGTSALRAMSMQLPQAIGALQMMTNGAENSTSKIAGLARFLGGPWGIALGVAIPIAGMMIEKIFGIGAAADDSASAVDGLSAAIGRLAKAQATSGDIGEVQKKVNSLRDERMTLSSAQTAELKLRQRGTFNANAARLAELDSEISGFERQFRWQDITDQGKADAAAFAAAFAAAQSKTPRKTRTPRASKPDTPKHIPDPIGILANELDRDAPDRQRLMDQGVDDLDRMLQKQMQISDAVRFTLGGTEEWLKTTSDGLREVTQFGEEFVDTVFDPRNWQDFGDMGLSVLRMIEDELIRLAILNPLKNSLFGGNAPTLSSAGGIFKSIFSGFFADGGTIAPGTFGIVGERGPEPVIGTSNGAVVLPNKSLRGLGDGGAGVAVSISIPIDATGADPAALGRTQMQLDELQRGLPSRIVATIADARSRGII